MDVLVFTPVLRLEPETVQAVFELEWEGAISFLLQRDNYLQPAAEDLGDIAFGETPPNGKLREIGIRNHLHQYQRGRDAFLAGPYQAMLVIESDIVPPRDTLIRLAELDADLAYGCYEFQKSPVVNVFERYYAGTKKKAKNVGESLTVRGLWGEALEQGVVECSGGGLGCVLIKRHVLEAIDFRIGLPESHAFCDSYFTIDVYQAGYSMKADTRVLCGHKTALGELKWPEGSIFHRRDAENTEKNVI